MFFSEEYRQTSSWKKCSSTESNSETQKIKSETQNDTAIALCVENKSTFFTLFYSSERTWFVAQNTEFRIRILCNTRIACGLLPYFSKSLWGAKHSLFRVILYADLIIRISTCNDYVDLLDRMSSQISSGDRRIHDTEHCFAIHTESYSSGYLKQHLPWTGAQGCLLNDRVTRPHDGKTRFPLPVDSFPVTALCTQGYLRTKQGEVESERGYYRRTDGEEISDKQTPCFICY